MGKYQKNIEAARRISVMQYLETYHPGELVRKTDKEYRKRTAALLLPLQMGSFTGTLKVWAATMLSTI